MILEALLNLNFSYRMAHAIPLVPMRIVFEQMAEENRRRQQRDKQYNPKICGCCKTEVAHNEILLWCSAKEQDSIRYNGNWYCERCYDAKFK